MKILFLTDEIYPDHIGGAGVVASQIKKSLDDDSENFHFICTKPRVTFFQKLYSIFWPLWALYILMLLIRNHYDRIIVNDLRSAYLLGLICNSSVLKKCVYIIHGTEVDVVFLNRSKKNSAIMLNVFYSRFIKKNIKIIYVSKYVMERTLNEFRKYGLNPRENKVVYAGLSSSILNNAKKSYININNKDNSTIRLVSFSRLEKRKGYLDMIDLFDKFRHEVKGLTWHIYGYGTLKSEIIEKIKVKGLTEFITVYDKIDRDNIFTVINPDNYDAYWLLPNEPEAFGLTYIECSAAGLPVFGPNKYGIKEAISSSVNGFFYTTSYDFMKNLVIIKNNKELFAKNAKDWALRFNSDAMLQELIN